MKNKSTNSKVVKYESNFVKSEIKSLVDTSRSADEAKNHIETFISSDPKFKKDAKMMLYILGQKRTLLQVVTYFYDSILYYEGLGVKGWGNGHSYAQHYNFK